MIQKLPKKIPSIWADVNFNKNPVSKIEICVTDPNKVKCSEIFQLIIPSKL